MKTKVFLIILLAIFVAYYSGIDFETSITRAGPVTEEGNISVHFCPQEDCEQILIDFLEPGAQCAFYDLQLTNLTNHLLAINAEVLIFDEEDEHAPSTFTRVGSRALMHNKFCIVEDAVITGSMNPTMNGAYKNNNNLLIIESPTLAANYREEWREIKEKEETTVDNPVINLIASNRTIGIENYFCPEDNCEEQVLHTLAKAQESIYFMTFSFTSDPIGELLVYKHEQNITVAGVFEKRQQNQYSEHHRFNESGLPFIWDTNPQTMHHKVFIIDEKIVITGSYNPTASGNERNDENLLIIHDEEIAEAFLKEYNTVTS